MFLTKDWETSHRLIKQWAETGTCSAHSICQSNMEQLLKEYTDASETHAGDSVSTKLEKWKQDLSQNRLEHERKIEEDHENEVKRLKNLEPRMTVGEFMKF